MFTSDGLALGDALNRETVAAEIEAALVGSVGLVLSVPLTTLVATVLALRLPAETLPAGDICTLTEREQRLCAKQGERDRDGCGKRVGISDQHAATLADPRLRGLAVSEGRIVVPWDVALTDPAWVSDWLAAAAPTFRPLIAFEHGAGEQCPQTCRLPSPQEFDDAVAAFHARWPQVTQFTAWNEPNHPSQPTVKSPAAAARFFDVLKAQCAACTVVTGDFLDSASMKSWFAA